MFEPDKDGVYARVPVSAPRRLLALLLMYSLGALLLYLSFTGLAGLVGQALVGLVGLFTLWVAERLRAATRAHLVLTAEGLFDSDGRELARMDQIVSVSRGSFAAKPSGGFALILRDTAPRAWAPGLWWRAGRRVGVGGVTSSGAARFMAEQIALRLD